MQANAILLNNNSLTGTTPATWDRIYYLQQLNLFFNKLSGPVPAGIIIPGTNESLEDAPLAFLDLSNNNFNRSLPVQAFQLPNLAYIDLSYNAFVGSLPQDLPANLAVLNLTANKLESGLPSAWGNSSRMAVLRLDDNALAGIFPEQWADLGKRTGNSLQLTLNNCSLHGTLPKSWVEQFCLQVARTSAPQMLFQPPEILMQSTIGDTFVSAGAQVVLDTQHASINFTLDGQDWYFTYQNTKSVCGVPDAARNAAIVWAVFTFALPVGLLFVCMCASKFKPLLSGLMQLLSRLKLCTRTALCNT